MDLIHPVEEHLVDLRPTDDPALIAALGEGELNRAADVEGCLSPLSLPLCVARHDDVDALGQWPVPLGQGVPGLPSHDDRVEAVTFCEPLEPGHVAG